MLHQNFLSKSGIKHKTVTCFDGKQALDHISNETKSQKTFLVLLDLNMPVMNGWEFLRACKSKTANKEVFVVVVTSSVYEEDKNRALKHDKVIDYREKPLTLTDIEKIKNLDPVRDYFS